MMCKICKKSGKIVTIPLKDIRDKNGMNRPTVLRADIVFFKVSNKNYYHYISLQNTLTNMILASIFPKEKYVNLCKSCSGLLAHVPRQTDMVVKPKIWHLEELGDFQLVNEPFFIENIIPSRVVHVISDTYIPTERELLLASSYFLNKILINNATPNKKRAVRGQY